ncbi:MAG: ATP-binding protein, partial [Anaerolineae bacterium]
MVERPAFVAREHELAWLEHRLDAALAGQGGVVFVTGGPGRGKTALLDVFARQAMDKHDELLVASGNCNAYSGVGDPYLPFREVLDMLSGDVEAPWASGAISRDHALRLWGALPLAVQALLDHGPHVVPGLLPGPALLSRAKAVAPPGAPWLQRLTERVERQAAHSDGLEQSHLFQQVTNLLRTLAEAHPLLLILDDLQWIDTTSAGLLFHLGRRLEGSRILVAGAYRPEEISLGREGERHPLEAVLAEFKRDLGDVWVDLAEVQEREGRRFVDAFLDMEPNSLGEGFRGALFAHTAGHPLFTVELLRTMQERGDLVQDDSGCWVEGPALDWETLPARVEGVIEARIGRLEPELREILSVASVEGEEFTAQVVARVQGLGERQALRRLSRELEARHRLVLEQAALRLGRQRLSRYRFAHALFQQYLYNHLGEGERVLLHGEVAGALEALYEGHPDGVAAIAPQLARHFTEAGDERHALKYLLLAGDGALAAYANGEAEEYYHRALALGPGESARAHLLSRLGEALFRQSRFREAIQTWGEGIERYKALEDSDGLARLYARSSRAADLANDPA